MSLKLRDQPRLDTLTRELIAGSRDVRPLTPQEFKARHAPTASQADAVAAYLKAQGFHDVEVADNNLLVSATGRAAVVARAFGTELHEFDVDGRRAYANVTDARVPARLADSVLGIVGLQTVHVAHSAVSTLGAVTPLVTTQSVGAVKMTDFPSIYSASSLPTASNATIAIITQGSVAQTITDLNNFAASAGYPAPPVTTTVIGNASADTTNQLEWNLDSQASLAAAGGTIKSMVFYDVPTLNDSDLVQGYNRAVTDNKARAINVSLGICENSEPAATLASENQVFQAAVAQGQMFSVSSGDSGAVICGSTTAGQSWPAVSPYVIAVGGTQVNHTNGTWNAEAVWTGAGGGPSSTQAAPNWQTSAGVIGASTKRGIPDISFDADPNSGALVLWKGVQNQVGGTSLAAPLWAGFWSRIQSQNANTLAFPAQALYAGAATHSYWFHDITSGNNTGYNAAVGWDYASGYGSLVVSSFATAFTPGSAQGTFASLGGTHTALDSGGDTATLTVKNSGIGSITGITYTCAMTSSATGSWYQYNPATSPSSLAPGASGAFKCVAGGSGMFSVYIKVSGTNASNSPFAVQF